MSKLFKNLTALFIAASLFLQLFSIQVEAAGYTTSEKFFEATGGNVYYEVAEENSTVTIVGCDDSVTAVEIPVTLEGMPVTAIGDMAFAQPPAYTPENPCLLESISFEEGSQVTSIGKQAFYGCRSLVNVTLPESLLSIGERAFGECQALPDVTIPKFLISLGNEAFYNCIDLTTVIIPEDASLTSIGESAFGYCNSLESITLPASLESIGNSSFKYCTKLESLDMADLTLLDNIPAEAFSGCWELTEVTIPACVETIDTQAFYDCKKLDTVTLQEGLTSIGDRAFSQTAIESIVLPDSLTDIGGDAFSRCENLRSVDWPDNSGFTEVMGFAYCTSLADDFIETLPGSVNRIGRDAFYNCAFTDVTIPANIESVGEYAFGRISSSSEQPLGLRFLNPFISFRDDDGDLEHICGETYYADFYGAAGSDVEDYVEAYNGVQYAQDSYYAYRFFLITDVPQSYTVSIAVPETAEVEIARNGVTVETAETSADGTKTVEATVLEGADITVRVSLENYYDKYFIKKAADYSGDWDIGTLTSSDFIPVPVDGRMYADISRSDTGLPLGSFDGLTLILENGETILVEGAEEDYTIQYPNIIISESIDNDAELTLTVIPDDSLKLSPAAATGTKRAGTFVLELPAWGKVSVATTGNFAGDNNVLFFDDTGKLIESGVTDVTRYSSDPLKSGSYTVVAFNANNRLNAVSTLASLGEIGLVENIDYVKENVTVEDETTTQVTLNVPLLNLNTAESITDSDGCYVTVEKDNVICGQPFNVRVFYSLKEQPGTDATVTVTLPGDASVTYVCDENSILEGVAPSENRLTLTTTRQKGVFYIFGVSVPLENEGTNSISASIMVGSVSAPLGSASFEASALKMEVQEEWLSQLGGSVTIYSEPNTDISLFVGNDPVPVAGRTNAAGRAIIDYTLPENTIAGQEFRLSSQVTTHKVDDRVIYCPADTTLKELSFVHAGKQYFVVKNGQNSNAYYTYVANDDEANKYWSFSAKFESSDMNNNRVTLLISMMDGSVYTEPMTLIRTNNSGGGKKEYQYAAEVFIEQAGDHIFKPSLVPNGFGIDYDFGEVEFEIDVVYVTNLAQEKADDRIRIAEEVRGEDTTDLNELIFNKGYIFSDDDWFDVLPSSGQQAAYEVEKAVDTALKELSDFFGLPKDIPEYDDWSEVFGDMGAEYSDYPSQDTSLLAEQGYTVSNDGSLAIKMKTETQPDGSLNETGFSVVDVPAGKVMDVNYNIGAWENATYTGFGMALNGLDSSTERFANWVTSNADTLGSSADEVAEAAFHAKELNKAMRSFGPIVSGAVAIKNSFEYEDAVIATEEMKGYIGNLEIYENYYRQNGNDSCWMAVLEELRIARQLLGYLQGQQRNTACDAVIGAVSTVGTVIGIFTGGTGAAVVNGVSTLYDTGSATATLQRSRIIEDLKRQLNRAHQDRMNECGSLKSKNTRMRTLKPKLDPSGIVYEALESNPLDGVTAAIWYATDQNGNGAVEWNAADYDEVNPQITSADGAYAWDVPAGWWQVRFTKEGYDQAQTAWMQVPPPRMNLVTPMVSAAAPTVLFANAYSDYIELVFSQYMDTTAVLTLPDGMTATWQNIEESLSKVLHIEKAGGFEGTVSFTLTGAKNYAGTGLGAYNSGDLTVFPRPAGIFLNYETTVPMKAGESSNITVRVKDADGSYMSGVTVDAVIANTLLATIDASAVTDENGKAIFGAEALLPGLTDITFTVRGTSISKTAYVRVTVDANRPARPTALVGGTSLTAASPKENYVTVQSGAQLTLYAEPGATIFYTTDDTCPCQNTGSRRIYTAPITLNANVKYRIAAYIDGKAYSERLNITVTVSSGDSPTTPPPTSPPAVPPAASPGFMPIVAPHSDVIIGSGESFSFSDLENLVSENKSLTVESNDGAKLVFDTDALKGIMNQTSGSIKADLSDVSDEYQQTHPGKRVFSLTVTSGDKIITDFGGFVTVSLPYELKEGENPENVKVWYLAADGSMTEIPCIYDPLTKKVSFVVSHFSVYMVGVADVQVNPFTDVNEKDWFYDAVSFAYEKGLMGGTGDNTFSPQANTSRGMIVTILWRLEGEPYVANPTAFADVAEGKWYSGAVAWAAEKGIVDGYSAYKFGPDDYITREQMAKILYSYAAFKKYDVSTHGDLSSYTDSPSDWALEYVQWAVAEGLLQGKGNGLLDPMGKTKRCEIAVILQRFIEKYNP